MSDYSPDRPTHDENGVPLCRAYGCPLAGETDSGRGFKLCRYHQAAWPKYWNEVTTRIKKMKRLIDLVHDVNVNPVKWYNRRIEWPEDTTFRQTKDMTQAQWLQITRKKIRSYILDGLELMSDRERERGEESVKMASEFINQGPGGSASTFSAPPDHSDSD